MSPINKSLERCTELGWRMAFFVLRKRRILHKVRRAYADAHSPEASFLRHSAEIAWGLSPGNVAKTRGYMYVAYRLQASLANELHILGPAPIGFKELRIHARSKDANSSRDYLAGFDESLTTFEVYRSLIPPGTVAVDVGANIGIHSLVLSRCVGEQGRVFAYEPSPELRERFVENMALNDVQNVTFRGVGAGSDEGTLRFEPRQRKFNIGLGKFDPGGPIETDVVRLDSDLHHAGKISFIKVDVEGMELEVIRGAAKILAEHRPALALEYNADWTLDDLRREIPYAVKISSIPVTLLDKPANHDHALRCPISTNLLVVPASQ